MAADNLKETKIIVENLRNRGIKKTDIDYATRYARYYLSQQLNRKQISDEHFGKIQRFYKDYLLHPDKYSDIRIKAEQYFAKLEHEDADDDLPLVEEDLAPYKTESEMGRLIAHQNKILETIRQQAEATNGILNFLNTRITKDLDQVLVNSTDVLARTQALFLKDEAVSSVTLRSLARLERKPEASLIYEADKIYGDLFQQLTKENTLTHGHKEGN